jgi:hypothetical protein
MCALACEQLIVLPGFFGGDGVEEVAARAQTRPTVTKSMNKGKRSYEKGGEGRGG